MKRVSASTFNSFFCINQLTLIRSFVFNKSYLIYYYTRLFLCSLTSLVIAFWSSPTVSTEFRVCVVYSLFPHLFFIKHDPSSILLNRNEHKTSFISSFVETNFNREYHFIAAINKEYSLPLSLHTDNSCCFFRICLLN